MRDRLGGMWLPKPIYEALPALYAVVGMLFVLGAVYLGPAHSAAPAYAAIGVVAILSGIFVAFMRSQARREKTTPDADRQAGPE
ncbi:MAG: hypothetical protein V2I25_11615 [Woeseiaceae bacterium]|nr:hypothetical protein [Woeseiaceae bacterium]